MRSSGISRSFRQRISVFALLVFSVTIFSSCDTPETPSAPKVVWVTSYSEGLALAKETGKPMLVDFTGKDWCGPCMDLKKNVFDTDTFKRWASKHVILVELDYPQKPKRTADENISIARKHQIRGFPTVLFISPDEDVLGRTGYGQREDAISWIKRAKQFVEKEKKTVNNKSESGT
jgi:protein disulfide-isomerase